MTVTVHRDSGVQPSGRGRRAAAVRRRRTVTGTLRLGSDRHGSMTEARKPHCRRSRWPPASTTARQPFLRFIQMNPLRPPTGNSTRRSSSGGRHREPGPGTHGSRAGAVWVCRAVARSESLCRPGTDRGPIQGSGGRVWLTVQVKTVTLQAQAPSRAASRWSRCWSAARRPGVTARAADQSRSRSVRLCRKSVLDKPCHLKYHHVIQRLTVTTSESWHWHWLAPPPGRTEPSPWR